MKSLFSIFLNISKQLLIGIAGLVFLILFYIVYFAGLNVIGYIFGFIVAIALIYWPIYWLYRLVKYFLEKLNDTKHGHL